MRASAGPLGKDMVATKDVIRELGIGSKRSSGECAL